jgi:hypothetical protein
MIEKMYLQAWTVLKFLQPKLWRYYKMEERMSRKGGNIMENLVPKTIRIDPTLWHKARVKALSENMTLQDLILKLLEGYLGKEAN